MRNYMRGKFKPAFLLTMLLMLASMALFIGCKKEAEVNDVFDYTQLEGVFRETVDMVTMYAGDEMYEFVKELDKEEIGNSFKASGAPVTADAFLNGVDGYRQVIDETGALISIKSVDFKEEQGKVSAIALCEFEKKEVKISAHFTKKGIVEILTFSPEYSLGEIAQKAAMNTVIGMGTVLSILAFIALIIKLFEYIPKPTKPTPAAAAAEAAVEPTATQRTEDLSNDAALVAVIAAAIAEYEGASDTKGFVVRSIKRRDSNRW